MIDIQGKTHIGKRSLNEDRFVADVPWEIALVSDGMGGAEAGEVAASIVSAGLVDFLDQGLELREAIARTHAEVQQKSRDGTGKEGMGATLVVACFNGYRFRLSWIGDSRAYLWNGELRQITRDHSQVERKLGRGEITPEQARHAPDRNLITRAMGLNELKADDVPLLQGTLCRNQRLLLCSDGLTDVVSDVQIASILAVDGNTDATLDVLVGSAVDAGGSDNITAVLVTPDNNAPTEESVDSIPVVAIARADGYTAYYPPQSQAGTT